MLRVAVCGAGAWGINHVRTFARAKDVELVMVIDADEKARARARQIAPKARLEASIDAAFGGDVDAIVLATPAPAHGKQCIAALEAGLHVLVEKPLALSVAEADQAVAAAERKGRVLMVGHLMLYHPAVEKLSELIRSGDLGELFYMYALRVNLGTVRRDENAMWSLAPHDVAMMMHLTGAVPQSVSARGASYLQPGIEDVVFVNMRFPSRLMAQVQLSWLDPRKERRLTIVGSQRMVEFDDAHPVEKLRIYDKGFDRPPSFVEYSEYLQIRSGDILIPKVPMGEPLERECRHFVECCHSGSRPRSDGASGAAVVKVLDAAQRSLVADGAPMTLVSS